MFSINKSNQMAKVQDSDSGSLNLIGAGTQIVGEIESTGDIRIDGKLKGNLIVKGKLVLGPSGSIEGDIKCKNADILGKVDGKVTISELLSLKATAKVHGDIIVSKISIEPGAIFTGTCKMYDPADSNKAFGNLNAIESKETVKK